MEFSIDIHTTLKGEIIVEDFSKEYNLYIPEEIEDVIDAFDSYKYSECASLNTIIKVGTKESTLIDVLLDTHESDIDSVTFNVDLDGYYTVDHIIIPNIKWWDNASEEYKNNYSTIYLTDGLKVYKIVDGNLQECTVREILERNIEGTTIKKCRVDVFYTAGLLNCYIDYCKRLFDLLLNTCNRNNYNNDIWARDFIWMTLNVIEYLVEFKLFLEAQRILEMFQSCGGFCKNRDLKKPSGCGCAQR